MTTVEFKDFCKTLKSKFDNYYCGRLDSKKNHSLGVYSLRNKENVPFDFFTQKVSIKPVLKKDHLMKDYLEYSMGGGKVKSAKQFLENDRKVLRFNAKFEGLKYISDQKKRSYHK